VAQQNRLNIVLLLGAGLRRKQALGQSQAQVHGTEWPLAASRCDGALKQCCSCKVAHVVYGYEHPAKAVLAGLAESEVSGVAGPGYWPGCAPDANKKTGCRSGWLIAATDARPLKGHEQATSSARQRNGRGAGPGHWPTRCRSGVGCVSRSSGRARRFLKKNFAQSSQGCRATAVAWVD